MTPDPAGLAAVDPTNPQSWNRYAYVMNNPQAFVDPLGLDTRPTLDLHFILHNRFDTSVAKSVCGKRLATVRRGTRIPRLTRQRPHLILRKVGPKSGDQMTHLLNREGTLK